LISGSGPAVIDYSRMSRGRSRVVRPKMARPTERAKLGWRGRRTTGVEKLGNGGDKLRVRERLF
jgi:hypothetical protein